MPIETGTDNGFMCSVSADRLDPLLAPSPRLDKGMCGLVVWVDMREVLGMWVEHEDRSSPPNSSSVAGHVGRRSPNDAVPFISRDVLDFSEHAFWRVNLLYSDDLSFGAGYHIDVVLE